MLGSNYKKKQIRIAFNTKEKLFEVGNPAISKDIQWIDDISIVFKGKF